MLSKIRLEQVDGSSILRANVVCKYVSEGGSKIFKKSFFHACGAHKTFASVARIVVRSTIFATEKNKSASAAGPRMCGTSSVARAIEVRHGLRKYQGSQNAEKMLELHSLCIG
jgi:hypothetical protein